MGTEFRRTLGIAFGLVILLFAAPTASAETWSGLLGGQDDNAVQASKPASRLGIEWRIDSSLQSEAASCVAYGDGVVFTSITDPSGDVKIVALRATDGAEIWISAAYRKVRGCPVFVDDILYASTQRKSDDRWAVVALEADDGGPVWEHVLPVGHEGYSIRVSDDRVLAEASYSTPGTKFELIALDATDGSEAWSISNLYSLNIVAAGEQTAVVIIGMELRAYSLASGTNLNWPTPNDPQIRDDYRWGGVIDNGKYFNIRTGSNIGAAVVERELGSGAVDWIHVVGGYSPSDLIADDSRVYVFSVYDWGEPARYTALNRSNGAVLWNRDVLSGWSRFFLLGDRLYVDGYSPQGTQAPDRSAAQWSLINPSGGELLGTTSGFFDASGTNGEPAYGDSRFFEWRSTTESTEFPYIYNTPPLELIAIGDNVAPEIEVTAPAAGSYRSSSQTLAWTADDGVDTALDHFEVSVNGSPPQTVAGDATSLQLTSLPAGVNAIEVKAVDLRGNESTDVHQITIVPSPTPVANLVAPPAPVLSGSQVSLSAGSSTDGVLDGQITRYEWDLDGNGSFETDGGAEPTVQFKPTQVGTGNVAVKVTNDSGNTATDSGLVDVRRAPPPGAGVVGVSINEAATFTNDPKIKLTVVWPAFASDLAVSNDGGFAASDVFPLPASGTIEWTLDQSGPERLPKTVYLRYYGAGSDLNTYTDDIILDQTAPVIEAATVDATSASASLSSRSLESSAPASTSRRRVRKRYRIRLKARDTTSGIIAIQAARSKRAKGPVIKVGRRVTKLRRVINPRVRYRPRLVRVKDAAGNWSHFRRLR